MFHSYHTGKKFKYNLMINLNQSFQGGVTLYFCNGVNPAICCTNLDLLLRVKLYIQETKFSRPPDFLLVIMSDLSFVEVQPLC